MGRRVWWLIGPPCGLGRIRARWCVPLSPLWVRRGTRLVLGLPRGPRRVASVSASPAVATTPVVAAASTTATPVLG
ncbi:hypothetical protein Hanom_Chr09g00788411 [Helianthus anomalus]